jgi:ATP-dependent RNA helicase DHX8/PRP22
MNESKEAEDALETDYDVLPVVEFKDEILSMVRENPMIIVIGETGSGKTTQIPQFLLDSDGPWSKKMIAVTQPRRIAAITVAQRVADERKCALGSEVGYAVRFDDKTTEETRVKYMTDGILVRECLSDKYMSKYSVIMLDEAHERSLNTDILFGLLKAAVKARKDLRIIITSATLDSEKFGDYFSNCPIIRVPGRVFPVDIYHSKTRQVMTASGPSNKSYIQSTVDVVMKIHRKDEEGHILIFLTGEDEIEKACSLIRTACQQEDMPDRDLIVLPLYSALSNEDQNKVFKSATSLQQKDKYGQRDEGKHIRKCVVSTNIAETSVTVPHVRFVIDAGYVKQKTFDPTRGMEALIIVPVSKISALQRAGRAGRTDSGQCFRLYSSECFNNMADETVPEIKRMNLSNTILYLKALGVRDVLSFDFIDRPSEDQAVQALVELHTLGALDDCGDITSLGRNMSQFPLEPSMSKVLIESASSDNDCLQEVIIIAAMLSVESIWYRPQRSKQENNGALVK